MPRSLLCRYDTRSSPVAERRQRTLAPPCAYREGVPDMPFGFGLPGGAAPDPNDPAQMQQFLGQLQQLFMTTGEGPVNWDLARQVALAALTGTGSNTMGF